MLHNRIGERIDAHEYPATTDDLIDHYGEYSLELPNGSETIADVLGRLDSELLESPEEARLAVYSAVSNKAVGRVGYSDRDPMPPGTTDGSESVSF